MHVIVVGCGRVGSAVAQSLDQKGHEVVVVDRRPDALQRLGDGFGGRTLIGVGFLFLALFLFLPLVMVFAEGYAGRQIEPRRVLAPLPDYLPEH